ncbi:MAG: hypothetical protein ISS26_05625 [Candidatus Omnitrophica bacterium]|nr:hypothetical protein [Candidatus Omnitrophota bacterium]
MEKKVCVILIAIIIGFLYPRAAEAIFTLELNLTTVSFDNMNSGPAGSYRDDVPPQGLEVVCASDQGNVWSLLIRNDLPLTNTANPASAIPDENFKWYGVSTSDPTNATLVTIREDFSVEKTVYAGAAAETNTTLMMKFELTVPPLMQSGEYTSNIVFTLTE